MALKFLNNGYFAGKVGIGTDSPSSNLDIEDASGVTIDINSSSGDGMFRFQDDGTTKWAIGRDNTQQNFVFSNSAGLASDNVLTLAHSTGNVGIGTNSPSEKLEVDGTIKVVHTDNSYAKYMGQGVFFNRAENYIAPLANNTSTLNIGYNGAKWGNIEINGAFIKFENGPNEFMRISSSGNVGIGTTSPNANLVVRGSGLVSQDFFHIEDSGGVRMLEVTSDAAGNSNLQVKDTAGATKSLINSAGNSYFNGGNVGIGTTSPDNKLTVKATNCIIDAQSTADSQTIGFRAGYLNHATLCGFFRYTTGDAQLYIDNEFTGNNGVYSDINFRNKANGGTSLINRMKIKGSTGNVGIGTTNPQGSLHVVGPTGGQGSIYVSDKDNGEGSLDSLLITKSGTTSFIYNRDSGDLRLGANDQSSIMSINSAGNVGIGTTSPNHKLDIESASSSASIRLKRIDTSDSLILLEGSSYGYLQNTTGPLGLGGSNDERDILIDTNGNVGIGTTSPGYKLDVESSTTPLHLNRTGGATALIGLDINGTTRGLLGATTTAAFVSYSTAAAPLVTVANTGGIQFNTYNAGTLVTDASGNITVSSGGGAGGPYLPLSAGSSYPLTGDLYIEEESLYLLNASNNYWRVQNNSSGKLVFKQGTTQRGIWSSGELQLANNLIVDGNVGIGTTSPSQKLDVSGIIAVNGVKFLSTIGSESYIWNNTGGLSVVDDTGNTVQLRIKDNGNVGIGTTNPRTKLHVTGLTGDDDPSLGSSTAPLFVSNTADSYGLNIGVQSSGTSWLQSQSNSSSIAYDLSLNPLGGNVGVGTTSPSEKLVVDGKIRSLGGTSSADFYSTGNDALIVNNGTQNLKFWNNGSERMRIKGDGNVGIGTTSPSSKLQVAGGIQMADDTDTASATKVGTMRYRTATNEPVPVTGTDLVINGDFSNGTTGWSFGAGWAVSNGGATVSTAGVTTDVRQAISYVANISAATKFRYRFEITNITAGSLRLFVNKPTFTQIANVNAVGVYEYVVEVSTGSNGMFYLYSTSSSGNTFQGTVTNVSVLEVTEEDASYADMCMQTGASTYEWVNIVRNTY